MRISLYASSSRWSLTTFQLCSNSDIAERMITALFLVSRTPGHTNAPRAFTILTRSANEPGSIIILVFLFLLLRLRPSCVFLRRPGLYESLPANRDHARTASHLF